MKTAATLAFTAALLAAAPAWADTIGIGLQDPLANGGALTTVAVGNGNVTLPATAWGNWQVQATATGTPPLPETTLDSGTIDVSTIAGGDTLTVWITELGLVTPQGVAEFVSGLTANAISGANLTAVLSTWLDPSDTPYGTADPLDSATFTLPIVAALPVGTIGPDLAGPFSVTQSYAVTCNADSVPCNADLTITTFSQQVPEPATLVDLAVALAAGAVAWFCGRRRTAASA